MDFVSIRIVTDDVERLVAFYERLTGTTARWGGELFAELPTTAGTLAVASTRTVAALGDGVLRAMANRSVIVEFRTADVDAAFAALDAAEVVLPPTTMPWGNRSALVRDPDGNMVNLYTPVTAEALARTGQP